eukprot:TRINITY_DN5706_c0_g1_i3.p1 TRINITY_DN5706_c0_g1~~TRINITY_DN5706_c0_g1_i3.p1  ORF type:complete len:228 (+),score=30.07 TRINITY_DN5706_c0_g1_i3:49-684(+)
MADAGSAGPAADADGLHPLEHEWTLWFDKSQGKGGKRTKKTDSQKWEDNLQKVGTFRTVEDFWRYFNNVAKPNQLEDGSNYHFFKSGVKPMWEDTANRLGGKWHLTVKSGGNDIDQLWENLVLAMVGEVLDADMGDEVCGAVFSRRARGNRLALWNRSKEPGELVKQLGLRMANVLNSTHMLEYSNHDDAMKSGASYSNAARFTIKSGMVV